MIQERLTLQLTREQVRVATSTGSGTKTRSDHVSINRQSDCMQNWTMLIELRKGDVAVCTLY